MGVCVQDVIDKLKLEVVYATATSRQKTVTTSDISRPGLELAGYFDYYTAERIQLFGMKEWSYMQTVVGDNRYDLLKRVFVKETPAVIVARGLEVPDEMIAAAKKQDVTILRAKMPTSRLNGALTSYLDEALAERHTVHGVFMDISGMGVLIQGSSGIGKSETGLELIQRGHRLIADDRVDVYQKDELTLMGEPAEILRHLIEIRGVGIIDVMNLFGAGAVKDSGPIDLAVYLEAFEPGQAYDRLGNGTQTLTLAGVDIPQIKIPVKTGRNVSAIIEVAVRNFRAKNMGFDATELFETRLSELIAKNS